MTHLAALHATQTFFAARAVGWKERFPNDGPQYARSVQESAPKPGHTAIDLGYALAGRNAVLVLISMLALARQNARFYAFAFLMHSLHELQDIFIAPLTGGGMIVFFVFLTVFVIPEILAYFTLNKMANEVEKIV